jgi:two-component system cell cycle sensor histidine kinase/response regulator CckA
MLNEHGLSTALNADIEQGRPSCVEKDVFDPFFTKKQAGMRSGLGLPQVYGIVKQSGGFIGLESEIGRGATSSVYLPALAEDPPNRPS